jgi:hypothetical protein
MPAARATPTSDLLHELEARLDVGVDEPARPRVRAIAPIDQEAEELGVRRHRPHVLANRFPAALPRLRALERGQARVEALAQQREQPVRGRAPELVLAGEVVREQALVDAGTLRDLACAGRLEALLGEGLHRSTDDAAAGGLTSRHSSSLRERRFHFMKLVS